MHSIRTQGLTTFEETTVKIQLHATKDVSHYNVMTVMIIDEQNAGPTRRKELSTSKRNCRAET